MQAPRLDWKFCQSFGDDNSSDGEFCALSCAASPTRRAAATPRRLRVASQSWLPLRARPRSRNARRSARSARVDLRSLGERRFRGPRARR
jgi:hypothetical protein